MREIWKDIVFPEGYEVSNLGRVRSKERVVMVPRTIKAKILTPQTNEKGSSSVITLSESGERVSCSIGRAVLTAFIGPSHHGPEAQAVRINTDKGFTLDNLKWKS